MRFKNIIMVSLISIILVSLILPRTIFAQSKSIDEIFIKNCPFKHS